MTSSEERRTHPMALAAERAARAAHDRAARAADQLEVVRSGSGVSVADALAGLDAQEEASKRRNEAVRRLVTHRVALANHRVLGHDLMRDASRLASVLLDESVRDLPLDP